MDVKLKPCPFCGCSVIKHYKNGNSQYLYCDDCGVRTYDFTINTDKEKIIRAWQKRTDTNDVITR